MSTLTGNKISLTYKSLFKTADNDVLTATLKQMSDGLGNNSGVYLNTGGDLKTTGILEFANFKGTSTAVTINKLVNEADGISNNDNDTSLPTSAAVKDYVDTHVTTQDLDFVGDNGALGAVDLDSQSFNVLGTTNEIVTNSSGFTLQIGLPDSVTISGTYTGATFSGDLNGTINTATTATTQSAGDNSTKVATTAYVDTLDAASDLDFSGTTGTGDVNLNTQTFAVSGTANQITTAASNQGLQISLLSTGVTMPDGSVATTQTAGDSSTKIATTAYVDTLDAASDLDLIGDSGTGDVNLNTQSFTLSGTTNQVITAVSGQTATFSLPATVHRNIQGDVTGDLTGNADTATKWQTARNLSLSGEATGTIASVDGSVAVSGAVTLTNSAVVAKVLTGLPTPAAGNIVATDTILDAFGKLQSQISTISSGLVFKGSWDADTNTPALVSGGGEVDSGTTTSQSTNRLIQTGQNFNTSVSVGNKVINQTDGTTALVTVIASNTELVLDADIMLTNEAYTIDASPFISQGEYYVVNVAGVTNLNGITDWAIGDWVIADADNRWSKLDHSQIDGGGSLNSLPVFTSSNTIGDSIVSQAGTALTITGSATTTLGLSSTGDFAVNTDKFTANATTGNTAFTGDLAINTNKFTVNATSGNTLVSGNITVSGTSSSFNTGNSGTLVTNDSSGYPRITTTNSTAQLGLFRSGGSAGGMYMGADSGGLEIMTSAFATKFSLDNDGNGDFVGNVIGKSIVVGPAGNLNDTTGVSGTLQFGNGNTAFVTGSADAYIYKNQSALGSLPVGSLTFQLRSDTTGGAFAFVGQQTAIPLLTIDSSGDSTFAGNITTTAGRLQLGAVALPSAGVAAITNRSSDNSLYIQTSSGNTTYLLDGSQNTMYSAGSTAHSFYISNVPKLTIDSLGNATFANRVSAGESFNSVKDGADTVADGPFFGLKNAAGTRQYLWQLDTSNNIDYWYYSGSTWTQTISLLANGGATFSGDVATGNMTISGQEIDVSSGDLTLDVAGDIVLSADGGDVTLFDGGTAIGRLGFENGDLNIASTQQDYDIRFKGNDGGNIINALFLDMSEGGNATFAGNVTAAGSIKTCVNVEAAQVGLLDNTCSTLRTFWAYDDTAKQSYFWNNEATAFTSFYTNSLERLRIDSSGFTTITNNPTTTDATLSLKRLSNAVAINDTIGYLNFLSNDASTSSSGGVGGIGVYAEAAFNTSFTPSYMSFYTHSTTNNDGTNIGNVTERMRITSDGEVLIRRTTDYGGSGIYCLQVGDASLDNHTPIVCTVATTATRNQIVFSNFNSNNVGQISTAGNSTSYSTSSDYRLKEDLQDFAGLDMVSKIPVYDFKWKTDESRSYGVMAHELKEVLPQAVSGDKDAEEMQSVDYSKIVPLLVKSIQELTAKVEMLEKNCNCK